MDLNWKYILGLLANKELWQATLTVVELSVLVWVLGVFLGLFMALANRSHSTPIRWFSGIYIWFFRSIPLLVLLVIIYNLPQIFPASGKLLSSPFISGLIGMTLVEVAYIAEIHRGGLLSIKKGQIEAGKALGIRYAGIQRLIVIPQAIRVSLPALGNEYITIVKLTSLVSVISLAEILLVGQRMYMLNFMVIETLLAVAFYYVFIVTIFDRFMKVFEHKIDIERRDPALLSQDDIKTHRQTLEKQDTQVQNLHKSDTENALTASKINKSYGDHHVLKDISLAVGWGEVISIIGPSGSGKTTLIRTLNGLETIDSGKIDLLGQPFLQDNVLTTASNSYQQNIVNIGMVFQSFNLFPHKTILENVTLAPTYHKHSQASETQSTQPTKANNRTHIETHALAMLDKVGLIEHANKYPHQLSGGQKQRVAIARTLAMKPSVILFDEPTSALDPQLVTEVLKVIEALTKEGLTMIIVTHEMDFAFEVSDRIIFMESGDIKFNGSPTELKNTDNERLQAFIS